MPSLHELVRAHTELGEDDVAWLQLLMADWQILADLSFGYRFSGEPWMEGLEAQVNISNLFDEEYVSTINSNGFGIRGDNQIYLEAEYRMELRRDGLLGAVVFLNSTHTTTPDKHLFSPGDLGAGLGMRLKFNKKSDTNLVIDYGWGREGARGLTLAMSEAF